MISNRSIMYTLAFYFVAVAHRLIAHRWLARYEES